MSTLTPLPRTEHGEINTSAEFGTSVVVKVTYYTEADGRQVDIDLAALPCTLHGPFIDEDEAQAWIDAYPDGDTDIEDIVTITLNSVRPS